MAADLGNVGFGTRQVASETVVSADGTPISVERSGTGPVVVVIGGGLNSKAMFGTLAELLSEKFTVLNYDRRGRGESGDNPRYAVDREVEDLEAVIGTVDGSCSVFANCTGGMIAVLAAARGVPMRRLAMYEPPYSVDDSRPLSPADYLERLRELAAADRREDAVALFLNSVGFPEEAVTKFKMHEIWPTFEAMAPTVVYDCVIGAEHGSVPFELLPQIRVPALVIDGGDSPEWVRDACEQLAGGIPQGEHTRVPGESHLFNQVSGAPILTEFFAR
jgi:acyltransferase